MSSIIDTTGYTVSDSSPTMGGADVRSMFTKREGGTVMDAHRQWATRPADEAVFTPGELVERTRKVRENSRHKSGVAWDTLSVQADGEALALVGKGGSPAYLTNWSMTQLAGIVGAPAAYMTKLPARLAAECLSHGLAKGVERDADANVLVTFRGDGAFDLRALTTSKYTRVWDYELAMRIATLCERGTWGPAQAFRTASVARVEHAWGEVKPLPLGWVGDRSTFLLLVDYEGAVTTKTGQKLARFVMIENSEVGGCALKLTIGLLDFVCGNMILWSCEEVYTAKLSHVGDVQGRFGKLFAPMAMRLGSGEAASIADKIAAASVKLLGDNQEKVVAAVAAKTKLGKGVVESAFTRAASTPRYGDPHTVWGMVQGLTEESQHQASFMDERAEIDRAAAKLLASF